LKLPDLPPARLDVLLPEALATQWFAWPEDAEDSSDSDAAAVGPEAKAGGSRDGAGATAVDSTSKSAGLATSASDDSEVASGEASAIASDDAPPGAIVFIDAAPPEAERGQEIESALGRTCHWMDPGTLNADAMEDLARAAAIVIAFDLGNCCGLDLLEFLQRDERTRGVRMAIGSVAPTHGSVAAALRAGARTFLCQPYDTGEIERRLFAGAA
jgi:hypothetical protein